MGRARFLSVFFACLLAATIWVFVSPAAVRASDEGEDISALKAQVQELMKRIDQLEKKEKKAPASDLKAYWKNGFRLEYKDPKGENEYKFRFRTGIQMRYTYIGADDVVNKNTEDYSNFDFRRVRFFVDGSAPNKDWHYFTQVQLEPNAGAKLLDATVQWQKYKFARVQFGRMKLPFGMEFW